MIPVIRTAPINPADVIRDMSIDSLCETADDYYRRVADPTYLMSKPFASFIEAPEILYKLGLVLGGLQLSKGFRVLDFASGSCWLSRILNQFGCATISMDVSAHALEMGRKLFALQPVLGGSIEPPAFIHFDGHHFDIPDSSVDRIVCFDGFHHVPNQRQVLSEFCRVLKEGGIVGFAEAGRHHSQSAQSQYEMANYDVLENDIIIEDVLQFAKESGFADAYLKPLIEINSIVTTEEYRCIIENRSLPDHLVTSSLNAMAASTVFFLVKGTVQRDSRSHLGLQHRIAMARTEFRVTRNSHFTLALEAVNTGDARWLAETPNEVGTVKIGIHLYTASRQLIDLDFHRWKLPENIDPGKNLFASIEVPSPLEKGDYLLGIDLVSEGVCWFENIGSQPVSARLTVD
jgi:ubiquinone/menaquinone biosynthesis C-methylase UbiE